MKPQLLSLIVLISCLIMMAGCSSASLPTAGFKSEDFTSSLNELNALAENATYPQQVPFEGVIPKSWYLECTHPTAAPSTLSCFIGIPMEKSYEITTLHLPCGAKYGRYILPAKDLEGYVIAWGDQYGMRAFHRCYYVKVPPVYPGQVKDYQITETVKEMLAHNPVTYQGENRQAVSENFTIAAKTLQEKVSILQRDVDGSLAWMDYLEKTFFLPNTRTWDKQAEVAAYKQSMTEIKDQVAALKKMSDKLTAWQF